MNNNNNIHFTIYTDNIQYTSDSMAYAGKRKREVLTLDAKRQILQRLQKGEKPSSLIAEFKYGKATISDVKKNKERILAYISTMEHPEARWLEAQPDCDRVAVQLLRRLQHNAANKTQKNAANKTQRTKCR